MRENRAFHMDIVSVPMVRWACPTREDDDDNAVVGVVAAVVIDGEKDIPLPPPPRLP